MDTGTTDVFLINAGQMGVCLDDLAGIVNFMKAVLREFPEDRLPAVVGGLHLANAGDAVASEAVACTNPAKAEGFTFHGGHCAGDLSLFAAVPSAFRGRQPYAFIDPVRRKRACQERASSSRWGVCFPGESRSALAW